jgi:hypothetical protein
MTRFVLRYGLLGGLLLAAVLLVTVPFKDRIAGALGMLIGYTSMVLAFLFVYFGVREYRDTALGGHITFAQAVGAGALIALVASACYVVTWEVLFFFTGSGEAFLAAYELETLEAARAAGATAEVIAAKQAEMRAFAEQYRNPLFNIAITFLEPLPVALIAVLVSAWRLRRRRPV